MLWVIPMVISLIIYWTSNDASCMSVVLILLIISAFLTQRRVK